MIGEQVKNWLLWIIFLVLAGSAVYFLIKGLTA